MHFLAKLYSDRLNENFSRNTMTRKVAPARPQPKIRSPHYQCESSLPREKGGEQQILSRFLESQVKNTIVADVQSPPPTYVEVQQPKIQLVPIYEKCEKSTMLEIKKPVGAAFAKPLLNRSGSFESAIFTDSEVGSNVSCTA